MFGLRAGGTYVVTVVLHLSRSLCCFQPIHPRPPVYRILRKRPDTLGIQITAQVINLDRAALRAIHFQFGHESPAACPELRCFALALEFRSQCKQLVDAFPRL